MVAALAALPKDRPELPEQLRDIASGGFSLKDGCAFFGIAEPLEPCVAAGFSGRNGL
jgi:hypothetical protein